VWFCSQQIPLIALDANRLHGGYANPPWGLGIHRKHGIFQSGLGAVDAL
jgi:hypothetical protein